MLTEPLNLFDLLGAVLFGACITALIYAHKYGAPIRYDDEDLP
jgi:hypothetical protein